MTNRQTRPRLWIISIPVFFFLCTLTAPQNLLANDDLPDRASHFSVGGDVHRFHDDFGIGIHLTTPYFANQKMAIQVSANISYFAGIPENKTEMTWMPYTTFQVGLIGFSGTVAKSIRLYGKGGIVYITPNSDFSDDNVIGGYGIFGFEFFMSSNDQIIPLSYYIELGSVGTGATAEKIAGKPIYANGFIASVGLRFYF